MLCRLKRDAKKLRTLPFAIIITIKNINVNRSKENTYQTVVIIFLMVAQTTREVQMWPKSVQLSP